jgi:hypothetical protein
MGTKSPDCSRRWACRRLGRGLATVAPFPRALIHIAGRGLWCIQSRREHEPSFSCWDWAVCAILRRLVIKMDPDHDGPTQFTIYPRDASEFKAAYAILQHWKIHLISMDSEATRCGELYGGLSRFTVWLSTSTTLTYLSSGVLLENVSDLKRESPNQYKISILFRSFLKLVRGDHSQSRVYPLLPEVKAIPQSFIVRPDQFYQTESTNVAPRAAIAHFQ